MPARIAVIACLDTKAEEARFLQRVLEAEGCAAHVIDTGVLGATPFQADTPRERVAEAAGAEIAALAAAGDRGEAIDVMSRGAEIVVRALFGSGEIEGVIAAGGSASTTIATRAMRALPVGAPKVMVSTVASGNVAPYVGTRDITMVHSIVDVAGINRISARILAGAARAAAAMARSAHREPPPTENERPLIAATMFGVTTPCVTAAKAILEDAGYEVIVFHATGAGGRAMEELVAEGYFAGVLDITTTELVDELVGGVLSAGTHRLTAAAAAGVPQVVSIGAVDMCNFGPLDTVPAVFHERKLYRHNPNVTLMRTTPQECAEVGLRIASRLTPASAPVAVIVPSLGVSAIATDGQPFYDPVADRACIETLRDALPPSIPLEVVDTDINDPDFARRLAERLLRMLAKTES